LKLAMKTCHKDMFLGGLSRVGVDFSATVKLPVRLELHKATDVPR
jgi:hypothetical protein